MNVSLKIDTGALADQLQRQIERQGVEIPARTLDMCQRDMDAITRLYVRGLIPESTAHRARQRVVKELAGAAKAVA